MVASCPDHGRQPVEEVRYILSEAWCMLLQEGADDPSSELTIDVSFQQVLRKHVLRSLSQCQYLTTWAAATQGQYWPMRGIVTALLVSSMDMASVLPHTATFHPFFSADARRTDNEKLPHISALASLCNALQKLRLQSGPGRVQHHEPLSRCARWVCQWLAALTLTVYGLWNIL